jgi:hypothetical protein
VTSAIMRNTAMAVAGQEEHLVFKGACVEAIGVVEDDGLSFPPIRTVSHRGYAQTNGTSVPEVHARP